MLEDGHRGGARKQDTLGSQQHPAVADPVEVQPDPGGQGHAVGLGEGVQAHAAALPASDSCGRNAPIGMPPPST